MNNILIIGKDVAEAQKKADELLCRQHGEHYRSSGDFYVHEVASGVSAEEVRELANGATYLPKELSNPIIQISGCEHLSEMHQGAFLTPLEGDTQFVLLSQRELLSTIASRCIVYRESRHSYKGEDPFLYCAKDGTDVVLPEGEEAYLRSFYQAFTEKRDIMSVLKALGLFSEKGANFFDEYKTDCGRVFVMIKNLCLLILEGKVEPVISVKTEWFPVLEKGSKAKSKVDFLDCLYSIL